MRNLLAAILGAASLACAQPALPDTPAGVVLKAWLEAFNSGNRAKLAAYLASYEPDKKDRLESLLGFREQTGGFNLVRIDKSEPLRMQALVKEREGSHFGALNLELNGSQPPTVKQFGIQVVAKPEGQPEQPRLSFAQAVAWLDEKAAELTAQDKFSGAVLIARGDRIEFTKAYGSAVRDRRIPNTTDTQFHVGSMNKMFTAAAILQLAGEGALDLAAPLGRYLPDYPNHEVAAKVTIRHLLTHTGGTGDIFTPEYDKHRADLREISDYVKLFGARGLDFEPGSKWSYSNYGFILLGAVMEKVSGISYYEYVRKRIFQPAGMASTDSLPESAEVKLATGYMRQDGKWVSNANTLPFRGTSAGGGYSTVGDLYRFARALSAGKLVKPELVAQMTSKQAGAPQMPPGMGYGFGMMVDTLKQGKRFGHGGGAPGMNGELRVYPRSGTVVVVLANMDPPSATRLADLFDERMPVD